MTSRFVALPVGQGDSFFLERCGEKSYLIDGGRSKLKLCSLLEKHLKLKKIDAVICTHNDADHANGIIGLLRDWKNDIDEIWLPYFWRRRYYDLLEQPEAFLEELREDLDKDNSTKEEIDQWSDDSRACLHPKWNAATAALRIHEIAEQANKRRNLKIRWFDTRGSGPTRPKQNGDAGLMEPVNSCEVSPEVSPGDFPRVTALCYTQLTASNKACLVFYSPENDLQPAVLFTADSDLNFSMPVKAPQRPFIVTAPHHGSETNRDAYKKVSEWVRKDIPTWVRSDCESRRNPGASFLTQPPQQRYCTVCNQPSNTTKRPVEFLCHDDGNWQWINTYQRSQGCTCR